MANRRPLVINNGLISDLLVGDTVTVGTLATEVVAGSGLTGGGFVSSNSQLDVVLAPNPSGIIYVGDALGIDGTAQVAANTALASGSAAAVLASNALASGNNSLVVGTAALASGNAALELVPTLGGVGNQVELTAASAVVSGYAVGVDDSGNIQSVRSFVSEALSFPSSAVVFEPANSFYISSTYDSTNNRIVVAYADGGNSNYATAIVGTVSGTSISFGTAVVFVSAYCYNFSLVYDSTNNKVVTPYVNTALGNTQYAIVGTVSGTSISFGTPVNYDDLAGYISATYDSASSKVVIAYRDDYVSNYGTVRVGNVSGTSISFGSIVVFESAATNWISSTYNPNSAKVIISYSDAGNSNFGTSIVGTVSGTSISFGTAVVFESATTSRISSAFDSTNVRVVIAYRDEGNSNYGTAVVGTPSGTSISFGTAVVFESATTSEPKVSYDSASNRVVIAYKDNGNTDYGTAVVGIVSGTSISFGAPVVFESATTSSISPTYHSTNNRTVISYSDGGNSGYGTTLVADSLLNYFPTLNSSPNVLGISQSTAVSGSPCLVSLPGSLYISPTANLTIGSFYYANPTTSGITTTTTKPPSWDGQVPWNYIGRAVSTSGLMLLKSI